MNQPFIPGRERQKGLLMVDLLIGVAVISIMILVVVNFYSKGIKAIATSTARGKAANFASGELDRLRAVALRGTLVAGTTVVDLVGYASIGPVASSPVTVSDLGTVNRAILVNIVNPNTPETYKEVTINVTDGVMPERFPTQTVTGIIRRPDPTAADTRLSAGSANLTVTLTANGGGQIPDVCSPRARLINGGASWQASALGGQALFTSVAADSNYSVLSEAGSCATPYWPKTDSSITLGVGDNTHSVTLNPLAVLQFTVTAEDPNHNPLSGVLITLSNGQLPPLQGLPPFPTQQTTDASGIAVFQLLPPSEGPNVNFNWTITASKPAYFGPAPLTYTFNSSQISPTHTVTMTPARFGTVTINANRVNNGARAPQSQVYIRVYRNYTLPPQPWNEIPEGKGYTNGAGQITFTIPVNSAGAPNATSRSIWIRGQYLGQKMWFPSGPYTLNADPQTNAPITVDLDPAEVYSLNNTVYPPPPSLPFPPYLYFPVTTSTAPIMQEISPTPYGVNSTFIYYGHEGPGIPFTNSVAYGPYSGTLTRNCNWSLTPGYGSVTPNPDSNCTATVVANAPPMAAGDAAAVVAGDSTVNFHYTPPANDIIYGPTDASYPTHNDYYFFKVDNYVETLQAYIDTDIEYYYPLVPGQESPSPLYAIAYYGGSGVCQGGPNDACQFDWTFIPAGAAEITTPPPYDVIQIRPLVDGNFSLRLTITHPVYGTASTQIDNIQVQTPILSAALVCPPTIAPTETATIQANVSGGIPSYTYTWQINGVTGSNLNPPPPPNSSVTNPTFQAGVPGDAVIDLLVNDSATPTPHQAHTQCTINVSDTGTQH